MNVIVVLDMIVYLLLVSGDSVFSVMEYYLVIKKRLFIDVK